MKQKLKKLRPLLFLTAFLAFMACQHDDVEHVHNHANEAHHGIKSRKITLKDLQSKPKAVEKINELSALRNGNVTARGEYNSQYDFYIDTDNITLIEYETYHSYTLPVYRSEDNGVLENLVLSLTEDDIYKAYLYTYDVSEQERAAIANNIPVLIEKEITATELSDFEMQAYSTVGCTLHTIQVSQMCSENKHDISQAHICEADVKPKSYTISWKVCPEFLHNDLAPFPGFGGGGSTGGGGGGFSPGTGTNPGGGTPPPPPNPDNPLNPGGSGGILFPGFGNPGGGTITLPVLPNPDQGSIDNCNDLKAKSADPAFIAKMNELKTDANGVVEKGMAIYKDNPKYSPKTEGKLDSNGNSYVAITFETARAGNVTGGMHCHLNAEVLKCLAVFSLSDLVGFADLIENSNVPVHEFAFYVTSNKGTFALKLTDKQAIIDLKNYIRRYPDKALRDFEDVVNKDHSTAKQVKGLLEFLKKNSSNKVQLYQSNSNFGNWQQKYLDENNKVKSKNC